jgi:hypothetical protein
MNTLEQTSADTTKDAATPLATQEDLSVPEHKIGGFDGGTRPVHREPSLYLSLLVVLIATAACLGRTPIFFWCSFIALSFAAVMFHVGAERAVFRSKKELSGFTAPFEGVFIITFGAIIPGLALLGYGIYSLATSVTHDVVDAAGKMALLLVVPLFNLNVWSSIRKGYLSRPRLTGLMNGLALGLSVSWTVIWMKAAFICQGHTACKFGWMLLLCTAPFLLVAAANLTLDLWKKTEPNIGRIAMTFCLMGLLLSFLFVFAPMARSMFIQSMIADARSSNSSDQARAVSMLRSFATDEDLRPSQNVVSGFALASMLLPDGGLVSGAASDKDLFFKITGLPLDPKETSDETSIVGAKVPGLALAKSQIFGSVNGSTLSGAIDWTLVFHNSNASPAEARAEFAMPRGAVVNRADVWVEGQPRAGVVAASPSPHEIFTASSRTQGEPLLVTMLSEQRVLLECFPVLKNGGEVKVRLAFKVPLQTADTKNCQLELPKIIYGNFASPKRQRINIVTPDAPVLVDRGLIESKTATGYSLSGIVKAGQANEPSKAITFRRAKELMEFATENSGARGQFIVQTIKTAGVHTPRRIFVVLDTSKGLKDSCEEIKDALAQLPGEMKPAVYIVEKQTESSGNETRTPLSLMDAISTIDSDSFEGGQDNWPCLRDALEAASEQPDCAVLWIHGAQPSTRNLTESTVLDLVHGVRLYDLQIGKGPNTALAVLESEDVANLVACESIAHHTLDGDLKALLAEWQHPVKKFEVHRNCLTTRPHCDLWQDSATSAQLSCLWAQEQVLRLLDNGQPQQARALAARYRLISPVTGTVVVENARDYQSYERNPLSYKIDPSQIAGNGQAISAGGLVGAPIDPRYGQCNEVGQMSNFGYDTARDIARIATLVSLLISFIVAMAYIKGQKQLSSAIWLRSAALVFAVPTVVHLIGTFMINNCGGLGAGL